MAKIIFTLFMLTSYWSSIAQQNIIATYKIIVTENKESKLDKMLFSSFNDFKKVADQLEFELKANNNKSIFYLKDKLYNNEDLAKIALLRSNYKGRVLQTTKTVFLEFENNLLQEKVIIKSNKQKWKLTNETKKINNFICYKAITNYKVVNAKGEFNFPIEAWYCPEVNFPFGPIGYGGLPGLIFELKIKNAVYGLKHFKLNISDNIDIESLKPYPEISEKDFNDKFQQSRGEIKLMENKK